MAASADGGGTSSNSPLITTRTGSDHAWLRVRVGVRVSKVRVRLRVRLRLRLRVKDRVVPRLAPVDLPPARVQVGAVGDRACTVAAETAVLVRVRVSGQGQVRLRLRLRLRVRVRVRVRLRLRVRVHLGDVRVAEVAAVGPVEATSKAVRGVRGIVHRAW